MKKVLLIFLLLIILRPVAFCANKKMIPKTTNNEIQLHNIFIYAIPDDDETEIQNEEELPKYVEEKISEQNEEEPIILGDDDKIVLGAATLKGYAQYIEDASVIYLRDTNDDFILNIKTPQKISASKGLNLNSSSNKQIKKYQNDEYKIAPSSIKTSAKTGNFTIGALFNNEIDNIAMLEYETGLFTKYEKNKFALSSSFTKSLNTTFAQDYNTISITPELKLNNYLSLKDTLSADITRNRRSNKLVFSLKPFGNKDRMEVELGAKQTVYLDTDFVRTEFSFSTNFKL